MSTKQSEQDRFAIPFRMSFPVISLNTFELSRASVLLSNVAKVTGKLYKEMPFKTLPSPPELEKFGKEIEEKKASGGVILDQHFHDRIKANPETLPSLKASLRLLEMLGINYVIAGRESLNEEFVYHMTLPPMTEAEINDLLLESEKVVNDTGNLFDSQERKVIASNARGLSHTQMRNVFIHSAYLKSKGQDYLEEIRREKNHILSGYGLTVLESVDINAVGGLENLKKFLLIRKAGWDKDLPVKGALLAGVPGGGKSLTARCAAGVLGTALVRLDMGTFYSKYLGETEAKFNRALQTIEQIAPVTVLIDEIEKFFGASEGEHEVSKRLLGTFLTWLQERKSKVFIVATANRVHHLPTELMRAGRWDRCFFIDLPSSAERKAIFSIHLTKNKANLQKFSPEELVRASGGYTGAEIEQAVIDALYVANANGVELDQNILIEALGDITPTSETRKADIDKIRQLKSEGFYPGNAYEEEQEQSNFTRRVNAD